jgi:hypothetical protein
MAPRPTEEEKKGQTRKILLATLAAPAVAAATLLRPAAAAHATTNTTMNLSGIPIDVGPAGCVPGDLVITGNGVLHTTVNNAGDSWTTGTVTGSATTTGTPTATGRATAWFGVENNNKNFVSPFTANAQLTLPDGSTLNIHQQGQFTLNANGVPVVNHTTTTCS